MSATQERRLDNLYKGFMIVMISLCGFFLMRLVNTVDRAVDDVQSLKVVTALMQLDISTLKKR